MVGEARRVHARTPAGVCVGGDTGRAAAGAHLRGHRRLPNVGLHRPRPLQQRPPLLFRAGRRHGAAAGRRRAAPGAGRGRPHHLPGVCQRRQCGSSGALFGEPISTAHCLVECGCECGVRRSARHRAFSRRRARRWAPPPPSPPPTCARCGEGRLLLRAAAAAGGCCGGGAASCRPLRSRHGVATPSRPTQRGTATPPAEICPRGSFATWQRRCMRPEQRCS